MKNEQVSLKPTQNTASQSAVLVVRIGEHLGSASSEWWCGCFITNIKKRYLELEAIADKALATGEYSAVHLYKVSYSGVSTFLIAERKENGRSMYYELAGFHDYALKDVYGYATERPGTNFKPRFLGVYAVALMLLGFLIGFQLIQITGNFWYTIAFPSVVLVTYLIMWTYDRHRYTKCTKSSAIDLMLH